MTTGPPPTHLTKDTMTFDLSSLGWDERFQIPRTPADRPDQAARAGHPGRPWRYVRSSAAAAPVRASIGGGLLAAAAHDPTRLPCAGDWVVLRTWPDERTHHRGDPSPPHR